MKRVVRILAALLAIVCMTATAMAAASSPDTSIYPIGAEVVVDGEKIEVGPEDIGDYITVKPSDKTPGEGSLGVVDLELAENVTEATITWHVPGVEPGDEVTIELLFPDGYLYTQTVVVTEKDTVTFTVTDSCTVEFIVKNKGSETPGSGDGNGSGSGSGSTTSPQTGETNAYPAACILTVLFACAAVISGRKAVR